MAINAMKILGAVLSSGALSRGSGSNVLGSVLGTVMGGGSQPASGGGMAGMLGNMLGGGQNSGGGLGGMLGNMLGGSGGQSGGGVAGMLGGLLGGSQGQSAGGGGLGALLGAAMQQFGGAGGQAADGPRLADFGMREEEANEQALLLVKAMINAAKADGQVDDAERERIVDKLGDITPEELEFVKQELAAPLDLEGFIRSIPAGMGEQVYTVSLMAIDLDSNAEAQYLDQLARGLGIGPEQCNAIHEQLGAPKLYT